MVGIHAYFVIWSVNEMVDKYEFPINTEYITLGQFLKSIDMIESGGMAKNFLETYYVLVDGVEEERRGKKLYPGTSVEFPEVARYEITEDSGN